MNSWDEAKRRLNLKAHGIDFADLEEFFDGELLTREDTRAAYAEPRYQSLGILFDVVLFVVWTPRGEEGDNAHLISARKAESHERQLWARRHQKGQQG